ncbi:hypothetical protein ANTRET_LOCUS3258 [Anthophora retusa]
MYVSESRERETSVGCRFALVHRRHHDNFVVPCWANNRPVKRLTAWVTAVAATGWVDGRYGDGRREREMKLHAKICTPGRWTRRAALNFNITKSCNPTGGIAGALTLATQFIKITMKLLLREVVKKREREKEKERERERERRIGLGGSSRGWRKRRRLRRMRRRRMIVGGNRDTRFVRHQLADRQGVDVLVSTRVLRSKKYAHWYTQLSKSTSNFCIWEEEKSGESVSLAHWFDNSGNPPARAE